MFDSLVKFITIEIEICIEGMKRGWWTDYRKYSVRRLICERWNNFKAKHDAIDPTNDDYSRRSNAIASVDIQYAYEFEPDKEDSYDIRSTERLNQKKYAVLMATKTFFGTKGSSQNWITFIIMMKMIKPLNSSIHRICAPTPKDVFLYFKHACNSKIEMMEKCFLILNQTQISFSFRQELERAQSNKLISIDLLQPEGHNLYNTKFIYSYDYHVCCLLLYVNIVYSTVYCLFLVQKIKS